MAQNSRTPKSALITGAEGALGNHVVNRFLKGGCQVFGTYRPGQALPPLQNSALHWLPLELSKAASVKEGLAPAAESDVLIHCAGGFRFSLVDQVSDQDLEFLIDANLKSTIFALRQVLPGMKKRGFGRIVLVSARATLAAGAGMGVYAATKGGINQLVSAVAEEVKGFDININAVLPTIIDTPANRKDMPQADFSKWVAPQDLAEILFDLTQPGFQSVNGALLPVAGRV
ncbi:SDR family NAD(P)-dependent oxidoreductase [bacterium]|jgi:NAD(P)-dependent dehydrogenase (short-subunit alcohol dehydrogenase family)|nr:SDR family NAD(P)-dependent oxidoreductase [bacterium]